MCIHVPIVYKLICKHNNALIARKTKLCIPLRFSLSVQQFPFVRRRKLLSLDTVIDRSKLK